jgi:hypothetical protein
MSTADKKNWQICIVTLLLTGDDLRPAPITRKVILP